MTSNHDSELPTANFEAADTDRPARTMNHPGEDHVRDLQEPIEALKQQMQLWGTDSRGASNHHRDFAQARIRALRNRHRVLSNHVVRHRGRPHARLAAVIREIDHLWAVFARLDSD